MDNNKVDITTQKKNPKISVIIAVYNTENYVQEAIKSIMHQTLNEIEIIIINDGSTDDSYQLIKELEKTDSRIQVYSQENKGQAEARNFGMQKAKGKYLYFMDSDDLLMPEALYCCYQKCEKESLDFVFFDAENFGDGKCQAFFDYERSAIIEARSYNGIEVLNLLLDHRKFRVPAWLYLVNRDFLFQQNLKFYPIRHEDQLFTSLLYMKAQRVGYIPRIFFKRRLRNNSVMTTRYSDKDISAYLKITKILIKDQIKVNRKITDKLIRSVLNPAVYNTNELSLLIRLKVFSTCVMNFYLKYLTPKTIAVLLFPFLIKLKSYTKKESSPCRQSKSK